MQRLILTDRGERGFDARAERAVNGEASARLVELVSSYHLKRTGAFFTSSALSKRAAAVVPRKRTIDTGLIVDPACGAGNLLLAAAKKLPVQTGLSATLEHWGRRLAGFDLHQQFIRAAHHRLVVLALARGAKFDLPAGTKLAAYFPHIRKGDGLREIARLKNITHLLINPPFAMAVAPLGCGWAQGRVTKAALFLERCVAVLQADAKVSAILPDVLRAGARYQCWREAMERLAEVRRVVSVGNFETADVDVFRLEMQVPAGPVDKSRGGVWWSKGKAGATVGERFAVHVGAVVPHRLELSPGPITPYLHAKAVPHWGEFRAGAETVAFGGRKFQPPFVAVRRTSSPTDRSRALGTVIRGAAPVAVENHLLVCQPVGRTVVECEQLLDVLRARRTNNYLNRRIRCRHLTVGVVREIPW